MAAMKAAARKAERDASTTEAMAGDYDHLLQTAMQCRTP